MVKANKPQAIKKATTGQDIVDGFGSRVRMVRKGPPHRIALQDGGWVVVDSKTRTLRVSGKFGDADSLAKQLAALEDYSIDRVQRRRLKRTATWSFSSAADEQQDEAENGRFDWWVSRGYTPELRAGGVAVEIDGTALLDRGSVIEVHTLPPSDRALDEIARYAATNWLGALVLSGPPGSVDWSAKDKERLWLACQRCGVDYRCYVPSAKLLRRWDLERGGDGQGSAAATLAPRATTTVAVPPPARSSVSPASGIDKIDAEINALKGQWSRYARDPDRIETMRGEIARLEGLRSELVGGPPGQGQEATPPPPRTPGA